MRRLAQFIAFWEAPLLVALAPLLLFPKSTAGLAMLGVVGLWLARWMAHGRLIRRTTLDIPILVILVMVLVSLLVTFNQGLSIPKVTGVVLGIAVFYTMVEKIEGETAIWWGLALFIAIGCGIGMLGLIGMSRFPKIGPMAWLIPRLPRVVIQLPGSPEDGFHPNQVAGAMLWLFPLLITMLVVHPLVPGLPGLKLPTWLTRALITSMLTLTGGILLVTHSYSAYVGMAVSLVILIWLLVPRARLWMMMSAVLTLASLLALSAPIAAHIQAKSNLTLVNDRLQSIAFRLEIWQQAVEAIRDFPVTGIGMGTFRYVAQTWYRPPEFPAGREIGHAHNHVLNAALDLGLPGLIGYLWLWIVTIIMLVQLIISSNHSVWRIVSSGLLSSMIAHFVWGMSDANALGSKPGLLLWMCFAIVTSMYNTNYLRADSRKFMVK